LFPYVEKYFDHALKRRSGEFYIGPGCETALKITDSNT
jgi:hypothetical protein